MKTAVYVTLIGFLLLGTAHADAQRNSTIGLRAGVGTDVNLGIAYGLGANYLLNFPNGNAAELGIVVFGGSFDETTEEFHTYEETTDITVIGVMANYLVGYRPNQSSTFFIAGVGIASLSVDWEERSTTDISLGTPLPGGGSKQSVSGSTAGSIFNLGFGHSFNGRFEIRLEAPIIMAFSAPGESAGVIPTVIATAGLRF